MKHIDLNTEEIKAFLDEKTERFNTAEFISNDPISIPHSYNTLQDIEITAFWVAILSWGNRKTIINKAKELFAMMDNAPYDFVLHHNNKDKERLMKFKHRTFQPADTMYFLDFLQHFYNAHDSLEKAFFTEGTEEISHALDGFYQRFFSLPYISERTRKHIAAPSKGSTCKRLNMFLRWMVRADDKGVDFGLWKSIKPSALMIPLDVHVDRVARKLGLLKRKNNDWKAVVELTENLRKLDPEDPVKYDYALFGLGVLQYDK